jgi:peptidoglycan/LPS O-acetylase OafA/YrhL
VRYNPALDGLRAVAILLVVADHSGLLPGGLIGVDVFFVLSGYLITSILLTELRQTGEISLSNFYWRRGLRLFPALGILAGFELLRSFVSPHGSDIRDGILVAIAYLQNWNDVFHFAPGGLMGHTWSLATEEQFYLLWPLVLPLVFKSRPLIWLSVAITLMVIVRFLPLGYTRPGLDFSPGLRPVGLLIGCALAFLPKISFRAPLWLPLGALLVVAAFEESYVLAAPLAASLATAVLILTLQGPSILGCAPLRYIGKISYGLFLYHVPIIVLGHKWVHGIAGNTILIALAFAAAALSYEFVEKPFLRLKDRRYSPHGLVTRPEFSVIDVPFHCK